MYFSLSLLTERLNYNQIFFSKNCLATKTYTLYPEIFCANMLCPAKSKTSDDLSFVYMRMRID